MPRPALVAALALALAACGSETEPAPGPAATADRGGAAGAPLVGPRTVADVVAETPALSTLAELVADADLQSVLRDTSRTVTLFAPSDDAFAALSAGALDALRGDPDAVRALLDAHTLPTRLPSADVFAEITFESTGGSDLTVDADGQGVTAGGPGGAGRVVTADLDTSNGVVHVVDAVLSLPAGV